MKVLVTGASGFIGQNLACTLVSSGIGVRAVLRADRPPPPPVCPLPADAAGLYEETVVDGPFGAGEGKNPFEGVDAVVHLAAKVHDPESLFKGDDREYIKINCEYTVALAREARKAGVKKFVFISSVKAMGEEGVLSLGMEPRPEDAYGKSKLAAEAALAELYKNPGTGECVVLYLPMVYGPGNKGNMLALLKAAARRLPLPFAAFTGKRSFLYVGNFCDAVRRLLLDEKPGHPRVRRYFLHDGAPLTGGELYSAISQAANGTHGTFYFPLAVLRAVAAAGTFLGVILGKRLPFNKSVLSKVAGEYRIESDAFEKDFGWRPPFSTGEGVAHTVAWYAAARKS